MRTTIKLDNELLERVRDMANRQGVSISVCLRRVIERGLSASERTNDEPYILPSVSMGDVLDGIDSAHALSFVDDLEDDERIRKMRG